MIRRILAAAVASAAFVFAPGSHVASADMCHLEWDVPCCPIPGSDLSSATVMLTICNCTDQGAEYRFDLKSDDQSLSFEPATGFVGLAPGECIDIPITVYCDANSSDFSGLFAANVVNLNTENVFECQGAVRPVSTAKVDPPDPVIDVSPGDVITVPILVSNLMEGPNVVEIEASSMSGEVEILKQPNPVEFQLPAVQSVNFVARVGARRGIITEFEFYDILLSYDANGDGQAQVNSSVTLRVGLEPCDGDLDGDGQVGSGDLAALLGSWGPCP